MSLWFRNPDFSFPTIYHYHEKTGEYLGQGHSDPSPLEEGIFADPAHSTRTKPPLFKEKHKPIWNGKNWVIVPDHRGEKWFDKDGNEVEIKELGHPADDDLLLEKPFIPEPKPTINDLLQYAATKRYEIETGGTTFKNFKIATDDRSKALTLGLRCKAEANPNYHTNWKDQDGVFIMIDAKMVIAISNAILEHIAHCFALEAILIDQIQERKITTKIQIDKAYEERR